jgi:hypothetical protein
MNVNVFDNSGASGVAQVHAHIKTIRLVSFSKRRLSPLGQIHQLVGSRLRRYVQFAGMLIRNYQQMAADVRIEVEDYETARGAVYNKVGFIIFGMIFETTKNAALGLWVIGAAGRDVFRTPGTPQPVQISDPLGPQQPYMIGGWRDSSDVTPAAFSVTARGCELSLINSFSSLPGLK